ncbi:ATP-binding cassette domain-containing protein [Nocardia cyriacigeorgica]|uniref:ATP-binding cassette domain-containing protein n=1 Tax=Nocardia cyriacigeorgica TaxID=135487 RepID=UPI002453FEC1|nr:ATP-binding cassette domain-containing protein [Nocardia cyriacigeorgica]
MPAITLDQVSVSHGCAPVLVEVDATFPGGECAAVVGASGAGKTTLLRLLNRLAEPDRGRILLDATPITRLDVLELRRRIGLVSQHPTLLTDTVADELRTARPGLSDDRVAALLTRAGLAPTFGDRRCAELSGGQAQRVCLARSHARAHDRWPTRHRAGCLHRQHPQPALTRRAAVPGLVHIVPAMPLCAGATPASAGASTRPRSARRTPW